MTIQTSEVLSTSEVLPHLVGKMPKYTRTGRQVDSLVEKVYTLIIGMDDHVSKPVRVEELVGALNKCRPLCESSE